MTELGFYVLHILGLLIFLVKYVIFIVLSIKFAFLYKRKGYGKNSCPYYLLFFSYQLVFALLQTYNEVQRCFLTVGLVYPEDLFMYLLNVSSHLLLQVVYVFMWAWLTWNLTSCSVIIFLGHQKCRLKEEPLTFGALCVLKHLVPRFLLLLLVFLVALTVSWFSCVF